MTDTRKVQLASEMDATGAKSGFDQIKTGARDMAREVSQQSQAAGKAVDKIGDGAKTSADKAERAYGRFEAQIRRVTAEAQAAAEGTGRAGAILNRAIAQGLDPSRLEPGLAKLRELDRVASSSMDNMGMSARATAAALRNVPAQFTDIVTSLASGQRPLTVLLQQGGQLKDMFGGAGNAARALGGYVVGLVNPFTVAAAAAIGLGAAYLSGQAEAGKLQRALIESGNAAGTTAGQMAAMAAQMNGLGQGTTGKAVEVLAALAATGRVGAEHMQRFAVAALAMEKAGGQAADKTVEAFAELGKAPLQGALKLNEAINFLTVGTYRQIKSLEEQGRTTEAARVAQEAYAAAVEQRAPQTAATLGLIERVWINIKGATAEAISALAGIGRESPIKQQVEAIGAQIEAQQQRLARYRDNGQDALAGSAAKGIERLRQQQGLLQEQLRLEQRGADAAAMRTQATRAAVEWDKESEKYLSKRDQMEREIDRTRNLGAAAGRSQVEIEKQIQSIREKYTEKGSKAPTYKAETDAAREYMRSLTSMQAITAQAIAGSEGLTKSQAKLREIQADPAWATYSRQQRERLIMEAAEAEAQEANAAATKASAKAIAEAVADRDRYIDGLNRSGAAVATQLQAVRDEAEAEKIAATGRLTLKAAIEEVTIARMRERQEQALMAGDLTAVVALEREIQLRAQLRDELQAKDTADANAKAAKQFADDWRTEVKDIGKSLTDALLDGGKSGIQRLQDWLRNVLLRVPVQAAMQSVAGSLLSIGGINTAAAAGATGSTVGTLGGIGSGIGALGGLSAVGSYLATGFMNTIAGTGIGSGLGAAGALIGNGSIAGGIGMGLGAVAPYALAALAVYNLFGKDKSAKLGYGASGIDAGGSVSQLGRLFDFGRGSDQGAQTGLVDISKAVAQGISQQALALGGSAAGLNVQAATDVDRKGLAAAIISIVDSGRQVGGVQTGGGDPLKVLSQQINADQLGTWFSENTNQAIIAGLQASDLPKRFADYFDSLTPGTMTSAQATAALQLVSNVQTLGKTFGMLGGALGQLDDISVSAADSLFTLFGGAQQFTSTVSSYIQAFYSEAERTAITRKQIEATLQPLGLSLPSTREAFRSLVDAQDLTTDSGRSAYAALMQVSSAFAEMTQAADAAATATADAVISLQEEVTRLRGVSSTSTTSSAAQLQAQYATATAAARAGDSTALASLPGLSQALEEAVTARASNAADVARTRAWLASSLQQTIDGATSSVPTVAVPGSASASGLATGGDKVLASLQTLTDRISALEDPVRASALSSARFARLLDRVAPDGDALAVRVITD